MHIFFHTSLYKISFLLFLVVFMPTASAIETTTPSSVYKFQLTMATRGHPQSQYNLAMMYEIGSVVEKSAETAKKWYLKSASQNYKPAIDRLIYLDLKAKGNRDKYIDWLVQIQKDGDIGDAEAMFLLGQMYAEGVGVEKDLLKARFYLQKAVASDIAGSERIRAKVETEISMHEKQ